MTKFWAALPIIHGDVWWMPLLPRRVPIGKIYPSSPCR
jgi:hypothetical protein